jgi:hypothetical protein
MGQFLENLELTAGRNAVYNLLHHFTHSKTKQQQQNREEKICGE